MCSACLNILYSGQRNETTGQFECDSLEKPKRIDVDIEIGLKTFAGTDDIIRLLLRDSHGVLCTAVDLDNPGNDHERNSIDQYALCCPEDFAKTNDLLSMLLVGHQKDYRGFSNNWFIERIIVHRKNFLLFEYRFHAWTQPDKVVMFGASIVISSRSNNGKSSYSLIRF